MRKPDDNRRISDDGQAAFQELCNNYDRVAGEVVEAKTEKLGNTPMNPGENQDDYFNQKHLFRAQVEIMREIISDRQFKDICVQGFSVEYNDVRILMF